MPRKPKHDPETLSVLDEQIIKVFSVTTLEQRIDIAQRWCSDYCDPLAEYKGLGVPPLALVIASLVDVEHPLLVSPGRGLMYGSAACALIILTLTLHGVKLDSPALPGIVQQITKRDFDVSHYAYLVRNWPNKVVHRGGGTRVEQGVYNMAKTVENV